jgi:hypothetical protein
MLVTLLTAGLGSLLALGPVVEGGSRSFRGAMATMVAATLLAITVAYLDLASKRVPTVSTAHGGGAGVSNGRVRHWVAPVCNCVGKSD